MNPARRVRLCDPHPGQGIKIRPAPFPAGVDGQRPGDRPARGARDRARQNVRLYFLCQDDVVRIEGLGVGSEITRDRAFYLH